VLSTRSGKHENIIVMPSNWLKITCLLFQVPVFLLCLTACQATVDESPQILGLSIAGVPQQNIAIDQQHRRITVVLPAKLPSLELSPTFILSKQAQLAPYWTSGKKAIDLGKYCPCGYAGYRAPDSLAIQTTVSNKSQTTNYTIKLNSEGPLRIGPLLEPVVYDTQLKNIIYLPVENYYGSSYVQYLAVTPAGSASPNWIGVGDFCFDVCGGRLNQWGTWLDGYLVGGANGSPRVSSLKPGLHDLDLSLADGTKVHATGAILVK
jgi:hypothetical protein